MTTTPSKLPLLGPGAELLRDLQQYTVEELHELAQADGLEVSASASHGEVAHRLVRERFRLNTNTLYAKQDNCFLNVDEYMPFLVSFVAKHNPKRVTEFGCGTGILASMLTSVLPSDGAYLGSDFSVSGVLRAKEKVAGDSRFTFAVADAVEAPILDDSDCILFPWVMNWLDTHAVERIWMRLAALRPAPIVIACIHVRGCVERRDNVTVDAAAETAAAEQYLQGDPTAARAIWDTQRFEVYVQSMTDHFHILEQSVQPGAHIFWATRSRER